MVFLPAAPVGDCTPEALAFYKALPHISVTSAQDSSTLADILTYKKKFVAPPPALREDIIATSHSGGHAGINCTTTAAAPYQHAGGGLPTTMKWSTFSAGAPPASHAKSPTSRTDHTTPLSRSTNQGRWSILTCLGQYQVPPWMFALSSLH